MIHIILILIKPFQDPCALWMVAFTLKKFASIRIEMFYNRIKVMTKKNFALFCSDPFL